MTRRRSKASVTTPSVVVDGVTVELRDDALLGVGGEGRVYRVDSPDGRPSALKLFHPIDSALKAGARSAAEAERRQRLAKLAAFPRDLPAAVVAPEQLVFDRAGEVVGYRMPLVEGGHELLRLSHRHWREGVLPNQQVFELFRHLFVTLDALHRRGVVVGDLNDGNGLFRPRERTVALIDADSMQLPGHPCRVFHERFIDPLLFDADLGSGDAYSPESDWYAFAVLLFASLLYVHPYGGVHPKLPTLRRRAEAQVSALNNDVTLPRVALDPRALGGELYDYFESMFDGGRRGVFPARLLEATWRRCDGCQAEYLGASCPRCRRQVSVAPQPVVQVLDHGRCRGTVVATTAGRFVDAQLSLGRLCWVTAEGSALRREDGKRVLEQPLEPGMRVAIAGAATWIGYGGHVVRVEGEVPRERLHASSGLFGETLFDASATLGCVVARDSALIATPTERRLGSVIARQCWMRVGERLGAGFYRAGTALVLFVFEGIRPMATALLAHNGGRIVDASCVFEAGSGERLLLGLASELGGRRQHALFLLDHRGALLGSRCGHPDEEPFLASIRGKALAAGRVLSSSDEGLQLLGIRDGQLGVERQFVDTKPFLDAETRLLPGPNGTLYLHNYRELVQLALMP
jgi:hypothetical protein